MKTVILCGGFGTRLSEETQSRPKPLITIGRKPIIWHIMKTYSAFGFNEFVLPLGYLGEMIINYYAKYHSLNSNVSVDLSDGNMKQLPDTKSSQLNWKIDMINTGYETLTGGRLHLVSHVLKKTNQTFMLTYGDGLSDIDINELVKFHHSHNKIATVTSVSHSSRFGTLKTNGGSPLVENFSEKSTAKNMRINAGFFVFEPEFLDYLSGDEHEALEEAPLTKLANDGQLMAYEHNGFWQCMDTVREHTKLERLWHAGNAPWKKHWIKSEDEEF